MEGMRAMSTWKSSAGTVALTRVPAKPRPRTVPWMRSAIASGSKRGPLPSKTMPGISAAAWQR